MKIALISHLYPTKLFPYHGKFIQDQFDLLKRQKRFEVSLIVPTPYSIPGTERFSKNHSSLIGDTPQLNRVYYLSFPKRKFPLIVRKSLSKKITSFLNNTNHDLVHVHWLNPDGLVIPELKKRGFKTILTIHGSDWYLCYNNPSLKPVIEETLRAVDMVLYSGPKLKLDIEKEYPELTDKSHISYNMVNSDLYKPVSDIEKKELRNTLGWETGKIHALTVANIRPEKGIDLLVSAIQKDESLRDVKFHIIGNPEKTSFSNEIVSSISNNPSKNIILHPPVNPKDLIKYYQAADFYVLPSRREGFNVSILEAVSCGLPLVCTKAGGNKMVTDLNTGILVSDFKDLSSGISEMRRVYKNYDPNRLHQIISQKFGLEVYQNNLLDIYSSFC